MNLSSATFCTPCDVSQGVVSMITNIDLSHSIRQRERAFSRSRCAAREGVV